MNISKKKKNEFDNIFKLFSDTDFYIDIILFRNLFESDYYENFLLYTDNKIKELLKKTDIINIYTNIQILSIQDTYYFDKIIQFSKLLQKYTININKIIIYGNSILFNNLINIINLTLGINIYDKIIFNNDILKTQINLELEPVI